MKIGDVIIVVSEYNSPYLFKKGDTGVITYMRTEEYANVRMDKNKVMQRGCSISRFKLYDRHINWRKRLK